MRSSQEKAEPQSQRLCSFVLSTKRSSDWSGKKEGTTEKRVLKDKESGV